MRKYYSPIYKGFQTSVTRKWRNRDSKTRILLYSSLILLNLSIWPSHQDQCYARQYRNEPSKQLERTESIIARESAPAPTAESILIAQATSQSENFESNTSNNGITEEKIRNVIEIQLRRLWRVPSTKEGNSTMISFKLSEAGKIESIATMASSGDPQFDSRSNKAVSELGPFPPLPPYMKEREINFITKFNTGPDPWLTVSISGTPDATGVPAASGTNDSASQPGPSITSSTSNSSNTSTINTSTINATAAGTNADLDKHLMQLNNEAVVALNQGNLQVAIDKFEEALRINPGFEMGKKNLSIAYSNYGMHLADTPGKAFKHFHRALALDPTNEQTRHNLDSLIQRSGKNPSSPEDRIALAKQALQEGDRDGALLQLQAAYSLKPDPVLKKQIDSLSGLNSNTNSQKIPEKSPPSQSSNNQAVATDTNKEKVTPNAAKSIQNKPTAPVTKSPSKDTAQSATIDQTLNSIYKNLNSLEQKTFSRTFAHEDVLSRLARLEQKIMGKVQTGKPIRRIDALLLLQ